MSRDKAIELLLKYKGKIVAHLKISPSGFIFMKDESRLHLNWQDYMYFAKTTCPVWDEVAPAELKDKPPEGELDGLIRILEIYGETNSSVSQGFYQALCLKAKDCLDQQAEEMERLKELLKEAQCPDILYCHNGFYVDTQTGDKSPCKWCGKREQALKGE